MLNIKKKFTGIAYLLLTITIFIFPKPAFTDIVANLVIKNGEPYITDNNFDRVIKKGLVAAIDKNNKDDIFESDVLDFVRMIEGSPNIIGKAQVIKVTPDHSWVRIISGNSDGINRGDMFIKKDINYNFPNMILQKNHSRRILGVSFSYDSKLLVSADEGNGVKFWDTETGDLFASCKIPIELNRSIAFSPKTMDLVTAQKSGKLNFWNVAKKRIDKSFFIKEGHSIDLSSIAFFPNGETLAAISNDRIYLYNLKTQMCEREIKSPSGEESIRHAYIGQSIAISYDSSILAAPRGGLRRFKDKEGNPDSGGIMYVSLWNANSGELFQDLPKHSGKILSIACSPKEPIVAYVVNNKNHNVSGELIVWNWVTQKKILQLNGLHTIVNSVVFSPDGNLLAAVFDNFIKILNLKTGKFIKTLSGFESDGSSLSYVDVCELSFSPNGKLLASGTGNGELKLWDLTKDSPANIIHTSIINDSLDAISISSDEKIMAFIKSGKQKLLYLWELRNDKLIGAFQIKNNYDKIDFLLKENKIILSDKYGKLEIFCLDTYKFLEDVNKYLGGAVSDGLFAFSSDKRWYAFADGTVAYLRDTKTNKGLKSITFFSDDDYEQYFKNIDVGLFTHNIVNIEFGKDNKFLYIGDNTGFVKVWNLQDENVQKSFRFKIKGQSGYMAFSQKKTLAAYSKGSILEVVNMETGNTLWSKRLGFFSNCVVFSPNEDILAAASDGKIFLFDAYKGKFIGIINLNNLISSLEFHPSGKFLLVGTNGSLSFYNVLEQKPVVFCRLFGTRDWIVMYQNGVFDTNNIEDNSPLRYVFPDDPFSALSPEIFMRDYYEPKLLGRVLAGEKLKPVPPLADLNRAQPLVKDIRFEETGQPDRVAVLVEVVSTSHEFILEGNYQKRTPGVYDVRLFRDGQLVGQYPKPKDKQYAISYDSLAEEKKIWKEEAVVLEGEGSKIIRFEDIRLPCEKNIKQVEFASYAFNEDRVKSVTSPPVIYELSNDMPEAEPKAYLVAVGVKDYESSAWNLQYAANDARIFQEVVSGKLEKVGDYKIVPTTLISDGSQKTATKAQIKACLKELSDKVTPDDFVMVFFSSHGYTDKNGEFYVLPYDIGKGRGKGIELSQDMLRKCISSEELSRWLREIDGGEMVLIVDACHSAATVDQPGFKPGPMGNSGLGQLAYDKGMRVLAASQADDYAIEHPKVQLGILTHALVRDGLQAGQGDYKPNDGVINLGEWLNYTVKRVPMLYQEVKENKIQDFGLGTITKTKAIRDVPEEDISLNKRNSFQQPALFDYSKTTKKVVFSKG